MDKKIYIILGLIIAILIIAISGVYFLSQENGENCPVCGMKNCTMNHTEELNQMLKENPNNLTTKELIRNYENYKNKQNLST